MTCPPVLARRDLRRPWPGPVHAWLLATGALASACAEGSGTGAYGGREPLGEQSAPDGDGDANDDPELRPEGADSFVRREGTELLLGDEPFRFAGTNNYYLMYVSRFMSDDVLETAAGAGFNTVRLWGSLDVGNEDGSDSVRGPSNGVYFQFWDGSAPTQNEGGSGLERLDYVIDEAGRLGLKLVIPFVNNWNDFGGMDQYVRWRERSEPGSGPWFHDSFYTDETIRGWYKDWIGHLLNRVNTVSGIAYKDDPTIAVWELGNEPRCGGAGVYGRSDDCNTDTLIAWAQEMTAHVKSLDPNHLVSVGDEGFFCLPDGTHWTEQCGDGVDAVALAELPNVDVMSYHLYPSTWGTSPQWGQEWITRHSEAARQAGKASLLGEFGLTDTRLRNRTYQSWLDALASGGGNGALYWILSGRNDDGSLYGDFDGFTIYEGSPTFQTLTNFASAMSGPDSEFPPVADHDRFFINRNTSASFDPFSNDVAYGQDPDTLTLDLDPDAEGAQGSFSFDGHSLQLAAGGIAFTPAPDYQGRLELSYLAVDRLARASNLARLTIVVTGDPVTVSSFETGVEGWAPRNPDDTGVVTQSDGFASDGGFGLQISGDNNGWYGITPEAPLDISARRAVSFDLRTGTSSTVRAVRFFDGELRCTSNFQPVPENTTQTIEIDITTLNCDQGFDLTSADSMFLRFSSGTFELDNVVLR